MQLGMLADIARLLALKSLYPWNGQEKESISIRNPGRRGKQMLWADIVGKSTRLVMVIRLLGDPMRVSF